jgi:hypothetical protein
MFCEFLILTLLSSKPEAENNNRSFFAQFIVKCPRESDCSVAPVLKDFIRTLFNGKLL